MKYDKLADKLRERGRDSNMLHTEAAEAIEDLVFALTCAKEIIGKRWIPITWEIPELVTDIPQQYDGKWLIFTDGENISVERVKKDLQDHFFPNGRWFQLTEATHWMPLPPPPKGEEK